MFLFIILFFVIIYLFIFIYLYNAYTITWINNNVMVDNLIKYFNLYIGITV